MEVLSLFNWKPLKLISNNNVSKIYKVKMDDDSIAIVKKITLPIDDDDAATLMEKGKILFIQDATDYYVEMMNNEIDILKKLSNNPNILNIYDTKQENEKEKSCYYIIMEYADDLISYYKKDGISEQEVKKLGIDICSALEACNKIGVVHNDIKPANIFYDGSNYKLGDFGNSTIGGIDNVVYFGTPNYLSPEIYNKELTSSLSDMYSLGLVMYHLLAGKLPFVSDSIDESSALKERMKGKEIPNIENINSELMRIVLKACCFDKEKRYQSVSDMKEDLEKLTNLSTEKRIIKFKNSKMNDTISVFDNDLIARQTKISQEIISQKKKDKKKLFVKKWLKKVCLSILLLLLVIISLFIYSKNRECKSGYINKNGVCTKGYYYCDTGYSLNEKNQCQKVIKSIEAKVSYSCPSGYAYTNDTCVSEDIIEPTFAYQCLDGFTLNGTKCEKTETNDAVVTYTCPNGYANMNGVCVKGDEKDAEVSYSCPSGYKGPFVENGTYKCSKYVTSSSTVDATPKYSCSSGTLNSSNKCVTVTNNVSKSSCNGVTSNEKCTTTGGVWCDYYGGFGYGCTTTCTYTCTVTTSPKVTYTCPNGGTLSGTKCTYSGGNTIKVNATASYTCPNNYDKIGTKCVYGKQINGTKVYTCLDSQKLVGDKCYTTVSTDAVGMYTCPDGFVASGVTCIQDDFPQPVKKYNCSKVYTLNGDKCEQYETKPAKAEFTE